MELCFGFVSEEKKTEKRASLADSKNFNLQTDLKLYIVQEVVTCNDNFLNLVIVPKCMAARLLYFFLHGTIKHWLHLLVASKPQRHKDQRQQHSVSFY